MFKLRRLLTLQALLWVFKAMTLALCLGLILKNSISLLFSPTPFMDEGYYLGATHSILRGDLLLHGYGFDKPFLLPFWPIPGIILLGETPLGFHFVPLMCYLASFCGFFLILQKLSLSFFRNLAFSMMVFSIPIMQQHGISNFCEAYLIFFAVLLVYGILENKSGRWLSRVFFLGLFTKYSFLLLGPLLVADEWLKCNRQKTFKDWQVWAIQFLKESRWILIAALVYSFANRTPFASITWFNALLAKNPASVGLGARTLAWVRILFQNIGDPYLAWPLITIAVLGFVVSIVFHRGSKYFWLFGVPIFLLFLSLPFSNAALINRYAVLFMPFFFIGVFLIIKRWVWLPLMLSLVAVGILDQKPRPNIGGEAPFGRLLYVVRQEINRSYVILHNDYLWQSEVFRDRTLNGGNTDESCILEAQKGVESQHFQFVLKDQKLTRVIPSGVITPASISLTQEEIAILVLKNLKLGKAFTITQVAVSEGEEKGTQFFDGSHLTLTAKANRSIPLLLAQGDLIQIEAKLGFNDSREYPESFNQPRYVLVARIDRVQLRQTEITDIMMPQFFSGYTVPVAVMEKTFKPNRWLSLPKIDQNQLSYRMTEK
jgi:hypothetical protein